MEMKEMKEMAVKKAKVVTSHLNFFVGSAKDEGDAGAN
jgi:hypothetical protein